MSASQVIQSERLWDFDVINWRYECLENAGYPPPVAIHLAEHGDVDLHDAVELLKRGCPVSQAIRILL